MIKLQGDYNFFLMKSVQSVHELFYSVHVLVCIFFLNTESKLNVIDSYIYQVQNMYISIT